MLVGEVVFKLNADTAAFTRAMTKASGEIRKLKEEIKELKGHVDLEVNAEKFRRDVRAAVSGAAGKAVQVDLDVDANAFRRKVRATVASAVGNEVKVDLAINESRFREKVRAAAFTAGGNAVKIDLDVNKTKFQAAVKQATRTASGNAVRIDLDVNATGFRERVRAAARTASGTAIKIDLGVNAAGFRREVIESIRVATAGLDVRIPIHADSTGLREELRRAIIAAKAGQRIDIPIGPGGPGGGGGGGGGSALGGSVTRWAAIGAAILAVLQPAISAIAALSAGSLGLISQMGALMGVLGGVPAAFLGIGAAVLILKENMKQLTPILGEFTNQLRPAIDLAGQFTQWGLRSGLAQMQSLLTPLRATIIGVGASLGYLANQLGQRMGTEAWVTDMDTLGRTAVTMQTTLGMAFINVIDTIRSVGAVASPMVIGLSRDILGLTNRLQALVEQKRDSGALADFFNRTQRAVENLGRAIGLAWQGLMNILSSGGTEMGEWLSGGLVNAMRNFRDWTDRSRDSIQQWFSQARPALYETGQLLKAIMIEAGHSTDMPALTGMLIQLRTEFLPVLGEVIRQLQQAGPLIINVATAIGRVMAAMPFGPFLLLANSIATLVNAFLNIIGQVPGLTSVVGVITSLYLTYRMLLFLSRTPIVLRLILPGLGSIGSLATSAVTAIRNLGTQISGAFSAAYSLAAAAGAGFAGRLGQGLGVALRTALMSPTLWGMVAVGAIALALYFWQKSEQEFKAKEAAFQQRLKEIMGEAFTGVKDWYQMVSQYADPQKAIAKINEGRDKVLEILDENNGLYARKFAEKLKVPWDQEELVAPIDKINEYYRQLADAGMDKDGHLKAAVDEINRLHDEMQAAIARSFTFQYRHEYNQYEHEAQAAITHYRQATDRFLEAVRQSGVDGAAEVQKLEDQMRTNWENAQSTMMASGIDTADVIWQGAQQIAAAQEGGAAANAQAAADAAKTEVEALKDFQDKVGKAFKEALDPTTYITGETTIGDKTVKNASLGIGAFTTWMQNTIQSTQTFFDNYQKALQNGFNPGFLAELLAQGPQKAGDAMKLFAQTTSQETVRTVNEGIQKLQELSAEAIRQAGILKRALEHPEYTLPVPGGTSGKPAYQVASAASAYITAHPGATREQVAQAIGATQAEIQQALQGSSLQGMFDALTSSITNFGTVILTKFQPAIQRISDANGTLTDARAKFDAWKGSLDEAAGSIHQVFLNVQNSTGSVDEATAAVTPLVTQFMNLGREAGISKDDIINLISATTGIPRDVIMHIWDNADTVQQNIDKLKGQLRPGMTGNVQIFHNAPGVEEALRQLGFKVEKLPNGDIKVTATDQTQATLDQIRRNASTPITVTINAEWEANAHRMLQEGTYNFFIPRSPAHAAGGWISGPGTGTSDSIPARLSAGEYVVNARSASRYGRVLEKINRGYADGGWAEVPGYAAGGSVIGSVSIAGGGTGSINIVSSVTGVTVPLNVSGTVTFNTDLSQVNAAIAAYHPVQWLVLAPDFARVNVAIAAYRPVQWLVLAPDFARVNAAIAAFHPVQWLVLAPDFSRVLATVAAFRPVQWIVLAPDFSRVNSAIAAFHPVQWLILAPEFSRVTAALAGFAVSQPRILITFVPEVTQLLITLGNIQSWGRPILIPIIADPAAIGNVIAALANLQTWATNTAAIVNGAMLGMAGTFEAVAGRVFAAIQIMINAMNQLSIVVGVQTGSINSALLGMAGITEQVRDRWIGALNAMIAKLNELAITHGIRMGSINSGSLGMAGITEGAVARVIGAYQRMQAQVDSLHGKTIQVTGNANVTIPNAGTLAAQIRNAANIIVGAIPGAKLAEDGMIQKRAEGGFDHLPDRALVSPKRGRGLVQWAEAESGGEAFIPLAQSKRQRSLAIWKKTGKLLGAFATGGLLNTNTTLNEGNWSSITQVQGMTDNVATVLGQNAANAMQRVSTSVLAQTAQAVIAAANNALSYGATGPNMSAGGPGFSYPQIIEYMRRSGMPFTVNSTYRPGSITHAARTLSNHAIGQAVDFGGDFPRIAAYWAQVGNYLKELIWSGPGRQFWKNGARTMYDPITIADHYDHVHVAATLAAMNALLGRGGGTPAQLAAAVTGGGGGGFAGSGVQIVLPPGFGVPPGGGAGIYAAGPGKSGRGWSQAQLEAAARAAGAPANIAHILGAIAMAETGGYNFPANNRYGHFDGPWAMMYPQGGNEAAQNTDIGVAAQKAVNLWSRLGFSPWEVYTNGMYRAFLAEGGILKSFASGGMSTDVNAMMRAYDPKTQMQKGAWTGYGKYNDYWGVLNPLRAWHTAYGHFGHGWWDDKGEWHKDAPRKSDRDVARMSYNQKWAYWATQPDVVDFMTSMNKLRQLGRLRQRGGHWYVDGKLFMAGGGVVPGVGTSDTVPAWLSPGEYVVNALATKRYRPLLDALNAKRGTPAGPIYAPPATGSTGSGSDKHVTHNWTIAVAADAKPQTIARELAWEFRGARGA